MSPKKKKVKCNPSSESNKHLIESSDSPRKRLKTTNSEDEEIKAKRRKNFITACELVSHRDYFDHRARLLLVYLPSCMKTICKHHNKNAMDIKQTSSYIDESFRTEVKNNSWYEALEVCHMCITPTQYLSCDVLKGVVEIMLNSHEDDSEYSMKNIIDKCQLVLMQNFSTHPPCLVKSLRTCYNSFLTSPMFSKDNTFTNRSEFECNKGIVKYCMNRLEHELSSDSKDGPIFDRNEKIPEEMKQSVKGLHWQKEKFEIYELLNRHERIQRLIAVLESTIELLQFDLAIWHSRYTNDLGRHIMKSHKPLMAYVLWSENVLYTGAVTNNCRQIIRIFANMIHLQYPESMIKIIATWLNTMTQTFYICETNSNTDYPNTSKYCTVLANDIFNIISGLPHSSINRILERIEPTFMRHLVGMLHINKLLATDNSCILYILINFLNENQWKSYPHDNSEIVLSNKLFISPKTAKNKINYLIKICKKSSENVENRCYGKMEPIIKQRNKTIISLNHVVHSLYITLEAYLDAYDIQSVQETWNHLNEQLPNESVVKEAESILATSKCYSVTESLIKKYRNILKSMKELESVLTDLKSNKTLPKTLYVFENIKSIFF